MERKGKERKGFWCRAMIFNLEREARGGERNRR